MSWKRHLARLLIVGLALLLAACTGVGVPAPPDAATPPPPTPSAPSGEVTTVRLAHILGPRLPKDIEDEVNRLLAEQGSSLRLELVPVASDSWSFREAIFRDGVGTFDIYPAYSQEEDYGELAELGLAMDITDLLPQFPDLLAISERAAWEENAIDGRSYWVPLTAFPNAPSYLFDLDVSQSLLHSLELLAKI